MVQIEASDVPRAVAAAVSTASGLGLSVDDAIVLHVSNRLAIRLRPSDTLARVAVSAHEAARLELDIATRLTQTNGPVGAPDARVTPGAHERDGFVITFWTYYEPLPARELSPAAYADALSRLHVGMRHVDVATPHFSDRVKEAELLVGSRDRTPEIGDADRIFLLNTFRSAMGSIAHREGAEQLLHGEPHPGNVLDTKDGPLFVDLETCCRGPVEFDLAHVPEEVSDRYPNIDRGLLRESRVLVLAMIAAWRLDPRDLFPRGRQAARELLAALREGPPYPALGAITGLH